jgi:hypothetical protein
MVVPQNVQTLSKSQTLRTNHLSKKEMKTGRDIEWPPEENVGHPSGTTFE